jgi:hypothetical protein
VIKVAVMDADLLTRNEVIGSVSFDASYVYAQKDHELYRKWLAIMNDEDPENTRVQGYLKASITMIGPGDKLKVEYMFSSAEFYTCTYRSTMKMKILKRNRQKKPEI